MPLGYGAILIITKPSRVTETSAIILDHIVINDSKHNIAPEIFETDTVSDH